MYKIQRIISAGAKMGNESKKYPGHQWLLWDLNLPYFKGYRCFHTVKLVMMSFAHSILGNI
jgi:hypothetical protein